MGIVTEYPLWFLIFCIGIAFMYAFLLYRKDSQFKETAPWIIKLLAGFRFIVVLVLSFLLLSPFIKYLTTYIEKPIILIAQDNSGSILFGKDSAYYKTKYKNDLNNVISKLQSNYEVKTFSFGDKVQQGISYDFSEKQTDISELLSQLHDKFNNRNVGALIIATDGIYNKGANPVFQAKNLNYPVYTVALGDSTPQADIILSKIYYNKIAFLGNKFPVQISVEARKMKNQNSVVNVYSNGQKIFTQAFLISSDSYLQTFDFNAEAVKTGLQQFKIEVIPLANEISTVNNYRQIIIDVIDSKQKVLLIYNSPHPDIAAISRAMESNQNIQLDISSHEKFNGILSQYNLIILHQLPSKTNAFTQKLNEIVTKNIPALFIIGGQSSLEHLNNLKQGFSIRQSKSAWDEAQGMFNKQFSIFQLSDEISEMVSKSPPLIAPFGDYKFNDQQSVLFFQKINTISTNRPLILFNINGETKSGFICGEGIWKWRISNFVLNSNHQAFDELMNKIVNFLALKIEKENFIVNVKKVINEIDPVVFDAELYNDAFELYNKPDVNLEIINADGKKFSYVFEKNTNAYTLNTGNLPVGSYKYSAKVKAGKKEYVKSGLFYVEAMNLEGEKTMANHNLLFQLSEQSNGKMIYPGKLSNLLSTLQQNKDIVSVSYSEKSLLEIIHFKWIFFVLLILLSTEWFLRKYFGGY
ncbi:MAG: hypothetical protein A2491_19730 [Bacteroidetes bacterium RIFOXYC12_FULL_35_7]|nr:MAG: hypothetical protein A2491_19730 [Bacteroidetes bacterium RIFOXYC12_FULL_35_7]